MIVDGHCHLWRIARGDYDWLKPNLGALYRDFEPADLVPLLAGAGLAGAVVVQAAPTAAETRFLLDLAARTPALLGVVGWTDLTNSDAPATIAELAKAPLLKGIRPMLQDLPNDDFILQPAAAPGLQALVDHELRFDALVRPRHLPVLCRLRERYPTLPIVVDHLAKPGIAADEWEPWASALRDLASDGLTVCKLSGMVTEAGPGWTVSQLARYADLVFDIFGPDRVMWGSDWPVVLLASDYDGWLETTTTLLAGLSANERAAVMGGTAQRFYGLSGEAC